MGKNNRQRRAAKQRQRQRHKAGGAGGTRQRVDRDRVVDLAEAVAAVVLVAAESHAEGEAEAARECIAELAGPSSPFGAIAIGQVVESLAARLIDALVTNGGWQPVDLQQITRRRLGSAHLPVLGALLAAQAAAHPASTRHPRWTAQLAELFGVAAASTALDIASTGRQHGLDELTALTAAVELIGLLARSPALVPVLPPPGRFAGSVREVGESEARLLARVRALLAKAESTEYVQEAEALTAKAQDLMTRHSLQALIGQPTRVEIDEIGAARLWLDAPYASAKSLLVHVVAEANRCRAVWSDGLGCVTVLGRGADLAAVELLTTSLLVQATRAMVDGQPAAGRRTRSFRQSFLVSFATRIGERLQGAADGATQEVSERAGAALLPVLRAASERVDEAFAVAFPYTVARPVSVSNGLGWVAGRAAADHALFDVGLQVTPAADPRLAETA